MFVGATAVKAAGYDIGSDIWREGNTKMKPGDVLTESSELNRMLSPVVPVPGVGQVGQGLQNSWGLEDDDEDDYEEEKNDNSGDEQVEEVTKMDVGEGDVVEISDSEEEEVVILNPEVPEKPKNTGSKSHQKGAAASKKRQKK